jgi:general secretion pathway protein C
MIPKQARLGVDIFTALVIASVGLALASLTWRLQGYAGDEPVSSPVAPGGSRGGDVATVLALAPFGLVSGLPVEVAGGALTLRAIFAASIPADSVALIAGPDGQVVAFGIGEATPGGVVEGIEPERVMLRTGTGIRILSFNPDTTASGALSPPGSAGVIAVPTQVPAAVPVGVEAIRALIPKSAQPVPEATAPLRPPETVPPSTAPAR